VSRAELPVLDSERISVKARQDVFFFVPDHQDRIVFADKRERIQNVFQKRLPIPRRMTLGSPAPSEAMRVPLPAANTTAFKRLFMLMPFPGTD
jgi:hypothetical protein